MKHRKLHKVLAITLATLMLFTSTGFSMDFHFCKGQLKSIALFSEASTCHEGRKFCPTHGKMMSMQEESSDCCSNYNLEFEELDEDFNSQSEVTVSEEKVLDVIFFHTELRNPNKEWAFSSSVSDYTISDLPFSRDIYVLNESYLL